MTIEPPSIEICSPEIGLVRIQHVRAAAGPTFNELGSVMVSVVATSSPVRVEVKLMKNGADQGSTCCSRARGVHRLEPFSLPTIVASDASLYQNQDAPAARVEKKLLA